MTKSVTIPDYTAWLPIEEVMAKTGMSKRTIYRKVEEGALRQAARPIPGRKPLPVFDPAGVDELAAATLKANPQILPPADATGTETITSLTKSGPTAMAKPVTVTAKSGTTPVILWPLSELRHKVYLETEEAVRYSGLTEEHLTQLARTGKIGRIETMRPFRYRRADLDAL